MGEHSSDVQRILGNQYRSDRREPARRHRKRYRIQQPDGRRHVGVQQVEFLEYREMERLSRIAYPFDSNEFILIETHAKLGGSASGCRHGTTTETAANDSENDDANDADHGRRFLSLLQRGILSLYVHKFAIHDGI